VIGSRPDCFVYVILRILAPNYKDFPLPSPIGMPLLKSPFYGLFSFDKKQGPAGAAGRPPRPLFADQTFQDIIIAVAEVTASSSDSPFERKVAGAYGAQNKAQPSLPIDLPRP
jgi:hypothetical protein